MVDHLLLVADLWQGASTERRRLLLAEELGFCLWWDGHALSVRWDPTVARILDEGEYTPSAEVLAQMYPNRPGHARKVAARLGIDGATVQPER